MHFIATGLEWANKGTSEIKKTVGNFPTQLVPDSAVMVMMESLEVR